MRPKRHQGGNYLLDFSGEYQHNYKKLFYTHHFGKIFNTDQNYQYWQSLQELQQIVARRLKSNIYATPKYWLKAIFLITTAIYLNYLRFTQPSNTIAILLGLNYALLGLNVLHDANHGSISQKPIINRIMCYVGDLGGISGLIWRDKHTMHHMETNSHQDPDFDTQPVLSLSTDYRHQPKKSKHYQFQHLYIWPLLTQIPITHHFTELKTLFKYRYAHDFLGNLIAKVFFLGYYYFIFWWQYPEYWYLPIIQNAVTGLYLGFFFIISHNFEGTRLINYWNYDHDQDWAEDQIATTSSVGGYWLGEINGGLNYQVEHHLFPKVCHVHYVKIQPIVRDYCQRRGWHYHYFPSIWQNFVSTYRHLRLK